MPIAASNPNLAASRNQAGGITKAGRPDDPSVKDADEVARALGADLDNGLSSQEVSRRLALKILSPDISHKSDVGGVRLNLRDENDLRQAVDEVLARVRELRASQCRR